MPVMRKMPGNIHINFLPNAVYNPRQCIRTTLKACEEHGLAYDKLVFEITEGEKITKHKHLIEIINYYKSLGFRTAIDDFGAGYAGLNLLAKYQPDIIKIDRALIENIHLEKAKQSIVRGIVMVCSDLDIEIIAEGVELREEYELLQSIGIVFFQGYYFARPVFENFVTLNGDP